LKKKIDIYYVKNSDFFSLINKFTKVDNEKYNFNLFDISQFDLDDLTSCDLMIFEEEKSYNKSIILFEKIFSKYENKPDYFIVSNNQDIPNVVKWMKNQAYDFLLAQDLKKNNLIKTIDELLNCKICEDKNITTKDYTDNRVIVSKNYDWETLNENEYYDVSLIKINIIMSNDYLGRYSKTSYEKIYDAIRNEVALLAQKFGGKIWFWQNNSGIIIFQFGDYVNSSVLAGIYFTHYFFIMCFEKLKLDEILKFTVSIHKGNCIYKKNTDQITSDLINSITHLDSMFTEEDTMAITEDVYQDISLRLLPHFKYIDNFEGRKIYQYIYEADSSSY
jgi:hypothetical protein